MERAQRQEATVLMPHPDWIRGSGRKNVHDLAAQNNLARLVHALVEDIPKMPELFFDLLAGQLVSRSKDKLRPGKFFPRRNALEDPGRGGHDDWNRIARSQKRHENCDAAAHRKPRGRGAVVGQAVPPWKNRNQEIGRERPNEFHEFLCLTFAGSYAQKAGPSIPCLPENCYCALAKSPRSRNYIRTSCRQGLPPGLS